MASQLQSRLEHLVSYSSQLIFVSGDTIAEQQRALQRFLSQQHDNTEIAYINGEPGQNDRHYRNQIVQQLLGESRGNLSRPLNELLSPLNLHDGPVLLCFCQAEHLPNSFLQELWELVLQSRFAKNRQHLNVILFGESQWASDTKAWLPAKNRDKPVLLSSESVTASAQEESELDKLIATKRKQFEQRLRQRAQSEQPLYEESALTTWWFKGLIGIAFLAIFSGILAWQYGNELPDLWSEMQKVEASQLATADAAADTSDIAQSNEPTESVYEIVANDSLASTDVSLTLLEDVTLKLDQQDDNALVSDWASEVARIDARLQQGVISSEQTRASNDQNEGTLLTASSDTTDTTTEQSSIASPQAQTVDATENEITGEYELGGVVDYPVEDIVSISQLPPPAAPTVITRISREPAVDGDSAAAIPEQPELDQTAAVEPLAAAKSVVDATDNYGDTAALLAQEDRLFVIQIAAMASEDVKQAFIRDNNLSDRVWQYRTQRFGGDWYVLLVNQSFNSLTQARIAAMDLPQSMQLGVPFAKPVTQVKQEITGSQ